MLGGDYVKTFFYEYGLFIVAVTGAIVVFSYTATMQKEFKDLSSKYIQIMTGVDNAEYNQSETDDWGSDTQ